MGVAGILVGVARAATIGAGLALVAMSHCIGSIVSIFSQVEAAIAVPQVKFRCRRDAFWPDGTPVTSPPKPREADCTPTVRAMPTVATKATKATAAQSDRILHDIIDDLEPVTDCGVEITNLLPCTRFPVLTLNCLP